jgi:hypothetical protein
MQAKREALEGIVAKWPAQQPNDPPPISADRVVTISQPISSPVSAKPASAA